MYKVGVIGDRDSILSFKTLGIDIFECSPKNFEGNKSLLKRLITDKYGVIFVMENIAQSILDVIDKYQKDIIPAIILIPSSQGSLGIGMSRINDSVEKAIGINIL